MRFAPTIEDGQAVMHVATFSRGHEPPMDDYMTVTHEELPLHGLCADMRIYLSRLETRYCLRGVRA